MPPDMARGCLLLLGARLAPKNVAVALAASSRSRRMRDVAMAPRATHLNRSADFHQQGKTQNARATEAVDLPEQDIEASLAELDGIEGDGADILDE